MDFKIILIFLFLLLIIPISKAEICDSMYNTTYSCDGTFPHEPCENAIDGNWSSYTSIYIGSGSYSKVYQNFSIVPFLPYNLTVEYKQYGGCSANEYGYLGCWNTSDEWDQWVCLDATGSDILNNSYTIPSDCLRNSTLQTYVLMKGSANYLRFYETRLDQLSCYLQPEYIDFSKFNYIRQFGKILHNHNVCSNNETLSHNITYTIKIDQNQSVVNVWMDEPCEFGCDNVTMTCRTSAISEYGIYGVAIIGIIIALGIIIKLFRGR